MNHAQHSMNKHEVRHCLATFDQLHLTPACLTTCCCIATFPFPDVKQTVFALLPGNRTDTFIDIYIYIYGYKYIFRSNSRGSRYARAFAPTDLLTSLRSGLRPSLREELFNTLITKHRFIAEKLEAIFIYRNKEICNIFPCADWH